MQGRRLQGDAGHIADDVDQASGDEWIVKCRKAARVSLSDIALRKSHPAGVVRRQAVAVEQAVHRLASGAAEGVSAVFAGLGAAPIAAMAADYG